MKTTTSSRNSIHSSLRRCGLLLIPLLLAYFALSPQARAVCQEGCLTNQNTVLGDDALLNNTTSFNNTATGYQALFSNTTGYVNTATGDDALNTNTTGSENTATGYQALFSNTTGLANTATGNYALYSNTTSGGNTAVGWAALTHNITGFQNTALGHSAGLNLTGSNNIAVGYQAGQNLTTGSSNIYIGNAGSSGTESTRIRIGTVGTQTATFIAGISGVTVPGGVGVIVGNNGKLGTVVSSARFKDQIKPMDKASESILALKPVTFHYKHDLDPEGIPQFGLVAEDVEKVNPDLVARDANGKAYTVRYEAVNAMLLNEFLKEHKKVERLKKDFESKIAEQQKQIEALTAGLQKVSAQIELSRPAPHTVLND
jgi:trimeric autotransporter adhesin